MMMMMMTQGHVPPLLGAHSVTQNCAKNALHFYNKVENFPGMGHARTPQNLPPRALSDNMCDKL